MTPGIHGFTIRFLRRIGHHAEADTYTKIAIAHDGVDSVPAIEAARVLTPAELDKVVERMEAGWSRD